MYDISDELLTDKLSSFLLQSRAYLKSYGTDSFACISMMCNRDMSFSEALALCQQHMNDEIAKLSQRRTEQSYPIILKIRNEIYENPNKQHDTQDVCQRYSYSQGHLRVLYKKCFSVSFYKDCIYQKIAMAKFLLCTTNQSILNISGQCCYDDSKYFLRQFLSITGMTPLQYRQKMM